MAPIFINYRRVDASGSAGRLYDRLVSVFGPDSVFMDTSGIVPGQAFDEILLSRLQDCVVFLAVIGRYWLEELKKRSVNTEDFVLREIEIALSRGIIVIPVFVDEADFTQLTELPPSIASLQRQQAMFLRHHRYNDDISRLIAELDLWKAASILPATAEITLINLGVEYSRWRAGNLVARIDGKSVIYDQLYLRADLTDPEASIPRSGAIKLGALPPDTSGTIIVPAGYHRLHLTAAAEIKSQVLKQELETSNYPVYFNELVMLPLEPGHKVEIFVKIIGIKEPFGIDTKTLLTSTSQWGGVE